MKHVGIVCVNMTLMIYFKDFESFRDIVEIDTGKFIDLCQRRLETVYPRFDHEAFKSFDPGFVERYEVLIVPWDHSAIESQVDITLVLGSVDFDHKILHCRCRRQ